MLIQVRHEPLSYLSISQLVTGASLTSDGEIKLGRQFPVGVLAVSAHQVIPGDYNVITQGYLVVSCARRFHIVELRPFQIVSNWAKFSISPATTINSGSGSGEDERRPTG